MRATLAVLGLMVVLAACAVEPSPTLTTCPIAAPTADEASAILADADQAVIATNHGEFTLTFASPAAPIATANFVALARCGFYDGITFHRVLEGFVIQAGDPQTRDNHEDFETLGTGGPGYHFAIEIPTADQNYDPYVVAMANNGQPDSNGSQFFICLTDLDSRLPRDYTIFGQITDGTEVVDDIGQVPVNTPDLGVPTDAVIIESITVSSAN